MQTDALFHIWRGDGRVPVAEIAVSWPVDPSSEVRVLVVPHVTEAGLRFVFGGRHPGASVIAEVIDRRLEWLRAAAAADASKARDSFLPVEKRHFRDNANIFPTAADFTVYGATLEPTQIHFDRWAARKRVPSGVDFVDLMMNQLAFSSVEGPLELGTDVRPSTAGPVISSAADRQTADSVRWARQALDLLDLMDRTARVADTIEEVNAQTSHDRALLLDAVAALRRQLPLHGLTTLCIVDYGLHDEDLQWLLRAHLAGSNPGRPRGNDVRDLVQAMREQVDARNAGPAR